MKRELWYIIVDGFVFGDDAAVGNFYGYGDHLGEAIDRVLAAARTVGFVDPRVSEVSRAELDEATQSDLMVLNSDVLYSPTKYFYPASDFYKTFVLPAGIAHSAIPGRKKFNADPDLITSAFYAGAQPNLEGEYEITLVLSRAQIYDTFYTCVRLLYPINGLFIRMRSWDDRPDDVWFNSTDNPETICRILSTNVVNTIDNGLVEIAVTASERARRTTLILNPHKYIQIRCKLKPVRDAFVNQLQKMGFRHTDRLYCVERGYSHMHYRPGLAQDRFSFERWLNDNGFEHLQFEAVA